MQAPIKNTLLALYKHSGALSVHEVLGRWAGHSFLAVLLFHRVTDEIPEDSLTIGCSRFRCLCGMLAHRFHVVPLADVFRLARGGATLPPRTVAITFDDCYRDNLAAARILAELGLPATFFLPTGFIGTDHVFPWDRGLRKRMPNLSWDDVREMSRLGFEIGSHTVTHADLGSVSPEQACRELAESKAVLEDRLQSPARWLAYPFGGPDNFRADWLPLLTQIGYEGCVSGFGGFFHPGMATDVLPREPVTNLRGNLSLEVQLTGCLEWYHALKRRLGLSEDRVNPCRHGCPDRGRQLEAAYPSLTPAGAQADIKRQTVGGGLAGSVGEAASLSG